MGMHRLPDFYYPSRTNPAYMRGVIDAQTHSDTDRASFIATMNLPSDDTPLRREDFFAMEDYLLGFYEGAINRLREERNALEKRLWVYEPPEWMKAQYKAAKKTMLGIKKIKKRK